jgi:GntR family transcriptional regulator
MKIRISKQSEVPLRQQLAEQIVFLIATEELKTGEALPSVRALARRLKIHHNTISEAYQDLVRRTWLVRRRGSRLLVRGPAWPAGLVDASDLDDLINATIRLARQAGFSLQALRERVRDRLLAQPPDHVLVVEEEPGLRCLLEEEIRKALDWPVAGCAFADLASTRGLGIGALVAAAQYAIINVDRLAPKDRPAVSLAFSPADEQVRLIQKLRKPSVIAVVSGSAVFLKTARSLLAPALERRHTVCEFAFPLEDAKSLRGADLIFCDSLAAKQIRGPKVVHYQLVSGASLAYLQTAMQSYQQAI